MSRLPFGEATSTYSADLVVSQIDEKSNIITLSFKDVSTQRAEDVLNTLIAVYNENWVRDKNQIAISTSKFIDGRLGVIERSEEHTSELQSLSAISYAVSLIGRAHV